MRRPAAKNPARVSKPLTNELRTYRSARRGDYRVLIRIDESTHVVLVVRIDHRADVYRWGHAPRAVQGLRRQADRRGGPGCSHRAATVGAYAWLLDEVGT